ncbi:uncharacterized protein LOC128233850 isoform X2 [Mya arenaria]|uniref:uncharacterized protein LOC128233850 isoform X2 n=1 Tax=Mya arenaria TaxID=6604 RepID=UPI0022E73FFC|nr:uncharacterized protein LOC128233850 isoform X2 [Mya arenaria]
MEMAEILDSDLSRLDNLTDETILKALKGRYDRDLIYTKVRDILIAINPRKPLPIYENEVHETYHWDRFTGDCEPHVFHIAASAYKRMRDTETDQVIIVSGESGAGKTESTKYMVKHIVHMCQSGNMDLHEKIIEVNPLLEAFGNAKTILNENSSRFAKYLDITFKEDGQLAGAVVRDYMLEKSRVVFQSPDEGIFHIFYALFYGCPPEKMEDLFLASDMDQFRIMRSDAYAVYKKDEYKEMYNKIMHILDLIKADREVMHMMLAAVINITEIEFEEDDKGAATIKDAAPFVHASLLLQLDEELLGEALISSRRKLKEGIVASYKTVKQAEDGRDALAKILYERMFGWLVRVVNQSLHPDRLGTNICGNIGILDIAGFEKLRKNSFEQLCINIVNEKLQNFMNRRIFTMEMEIYQDENIHLDGISFKNNDDIIEMFEQPKTGLLAVLDEVSNFKQGSDQAFALQIKKAFKEHPNFVNQGVETMFGISHFAAMVPYDAEGFMEKNRDRLNPELMDVMKASTDEFISDLFSVKRGPTGTISSTHMNYRQSTRHRPGHQVKLKQTPKGQELAAQLGKSLKTKFGTVHKPSKTNRPTPPDQTLVAFFRKSLLDLLAKLGSAEPFFVRCIKANNTHRENEFDSQVVNDQLKYNGLAEVAKIRKMGFAVRKPFQEFVTRYRCLSSFLIPSGELRGQAEQILLQSPAKYHKCFRLGKTKVFFTHELDTHFEVLLHLRRKIASKQVTKVMKRVAQIKKAERLERERQEIERKRLEQERLEHEQQEKEKKERESQNSVYENPDVTQEEHSDQENTASSDEDNTGNDPLITLGGTAKPILGGTFDRTKESTYTGGSFKDYRGTRRAPSPTPGPSSSESSSVYDNVPPTNPPTPPVPSHDHKKQMKKQIPFWDVAQIIARERRIRDVDEDRGLQVIKVVAYIVFIAAMLWCAVSQKLSLMTLVSHQYNRGENITESDLHENLVEATARHILLAIAILIPYCLMFLSSMFKWMFGSFLFPNWGTVFFCVFMEVMHSIGLCILVFIVLPDMDTVRGIILINGVAILPSLLYPICASEVKLHADHRRRGITLNKAVTFCLNIVVAIVQVGFIPLVLVSDNFLETSWMDRGLANIVYFIIGMIFVSFSSWENFTDDRFCGKTNKQSLIKGWLLGVKFDLQESRPVLTFFTSVTKIGVTCLLVYLTKLGKPFGGDDENSFTHSIASISAGEAFAKLGDLPIKDNSAILTLTLTAFVGYYVGYTSCKLKLQRLAFSLPLLLSTPIAVLVAHFDCRHNWLDPFTNEDRNQCLDDGVLGLILLYVTGAIIWLSIYWLCAHIFYPDIERLAKTERLFMNPFYCGILFEQNTLLNRRRHNRRVKKELRGDDEFFSLSEFNFKVNVEGEEEEDKETPSKSRENMGNTNVVGDIEEGFLTNNEDNDDEETDVNSDSYRNPKFRDVPMIYACATMWHETKVEMIQLMKSIFRMDRDQNLRRMGEILAMKEDKDFYEMEAHIFFDDCMELDDDGEMIPNQFVKSLLSILDEAVSAVYSKFMKCKKPFLVPTPYGGQLVISMPGDNFLFIHLKDKAKIRHKKRWSQVMYMYYLLGFRIVRHCQEYVTSALESGKINELISWEDGANAAGNIGKSHIFHVFDEQTNKRASNTFILALDGDVDFSPGAVKLLIDRMKKSEKVGAACGRIHPIGTGPVVWFQKFEYAIAHWLQKATEHVLGCVLCSPGCFSLFRGSALMDDNIMKKYTIIPTEPAHHLMYDQGEDRWLCTLLLQQGYRVDYAAGADAFTYAPEGFGEFFNQRRRWMPSTVFNIIDLLADYQNTVYINSNISMLYIFYQASLLVSTIIGPATILMMIAGANLIVFGTNLIWSYVIAMIPAIFYSIICFYVKTKVQIQLAEILTGIYAFIMMIVLVGTIVTAAKESPFHPSVLFISFLVFAFMFSAMLHPKEWTCVIYGAMYFILIPTGFLLLIIYSMANLHVISWGTREVPKKKTKEEIEKEKKDADEKKKKKKERGFFGRFMPSLPMKEFKEMITKLTETKRDEPMKDNSETVRLLKEMNECMHKLVGEKTHGEDAKAPEETIPKTIDEEPEKEPPSFRKTSQEPKGILKKSGKHNEKRLSVSVSDRDDEIIGEQDKPTENKKRNDLENPKWAEIDELSHGKKIKMVDEELHFWENFIARYLKPLELSEEKKKNDLNGLLELRTNICIGMVIINLLWIAINFMFQFTSPANIKLTQSTASASGEDIEEEQVLEESDSSSSNPIANLEVDALGLMFVFFYMVILLIQFAGMIMHRWGTFLHLVSVTTLRNPFDMEKLRKKRDERDAELMEKRDRHLSNKEAIRVCEDILLEPLPDYSDSDSDDESFTHNDEEQLKALQKTGTRLGVTVKGNQIGASTRCFDRNTMGQSARIQNLRISKSANIIANTLKATNNRIVSPEGEQMRFEAQNLYRKQKDKYVDRPLPQVRKKRYNLGPGRRAMSSQWDRYLSRQTAREGSNNLIDEDDAPDEEIYDVISKQGTVGRQLGRKLKLYSRTDQVRKKGVHFSSSTTDPRPRPRSMVPSYPNGPTRNGYNNVRL